MIQIYRNGVDRAQKTFENHPLTQMLTPKQAEALFIWAEQKLKGFNRTSSAVEGRNGYLAQRNHSLRGMSAGRLAALTVIHNYHLKDIEGKSPAERMSRLKEVPQNSMYVLVLLSIWNLLQ